MELLGYYFQHSVILYDFFIAAFKRHNQTQGFTN